MTLRPAKKTEEDVSRHASVCSDRLTETLCLNKYSRERINVIIDSNYFPDSMPSEGKRRSEMCSLWHDTTEKE